jgi:sporulation protein YlmC with PRC-barrel domain
MPLAPVDGGPRRQRTRQIDPAIKEDSMNTQIRSTVFGIAVATVAITTAWTQERGNAPQRTAETTLAEWLEDKDARLSELIGRRVINEHGTDLGEVEDLLAKAGRDQEPVVVLSIGGVADIGDKWYAASLDQLRIASDNARLVLDKTEAELEAAPELDYVPMRGEESHLPGVRGPHTVNAVGRLLGATVVDDSGESIGEIEDFVVSTGNRGTRAVVSLDEDAGIGVEDRLVAIAVEDLAIEISGEEAAAVPQQARVRAELDAPVEALPVYEYPEVEPI